MSLIFLYWNSYFLLAFCLAPDGTTPTPLPCGPTPQPHPQAVCMLETCNQRFTKTTTCKKYIIIQMKQKIQYKITHKFLQLVITFIPLVNDIFGYECQEILNLASVSLFELFYTEMEMQRGWPVGGTAYYGDTTPFKWVRTQKWSFLQGLIFKWDCKTKCTQFKKINGRKELDTYSHWMGRQHRVPVCSWGFLLVA